MNEAVAIVEFSIATGFLFFAYQRWQMGYRAAAVMAATLATYFGRIGLVYAGRAWELGSFERAIEPSAVLTNATLLLLAVLLAVIEAHEAGFRQWLERRRERRQ